MTREHVTWEQTEEQSNYQTCVYELLRTPAISATLAHIVLMPQLRYAFSITDIQRANHDCGHHSGGDSNDNQLTAPTNLVEPRDHEPLTGEEETENNEALANTCTGQC